MTLNIIAKRIWSFLSAKDITLTASWIPSKLNVGPNFRSRLKPNSSEWKLDKKVFKKITNRWGNPSVDLFASRTMHQLDRYVSLSPDPACQAVDAMAQNWEATYPYLFPPFCMVGRVLRKLIRHRVEKAILIPPMWPGQPWFPPLLEQCIQHPLRLPLKRDLILDSEGNTHNLQEARSLHLTAFLVTGQPSLAKGYQAGLQTWSSMPGERARQILTKAPGGSGFLGAVQEALIPIG